jgi:hypothetical protein
MITCKNCGHQFSGKYCNNCGEKVYTEKDKNVLHFFEEGLHFITHFEGKFFNTIKAIFTKPGKLSTEYCHGVRKTYFKPLSFFLLLVVVYLLFPVFEGLNMRLYYNTHHNFYGKYAMKKAVALMGQKHWTDIQLTEAYQHMSEKVSKFLLLILLPLTALFLWLFTFKKRKHFFDQMVIATEINSVYVVWGFMIMPLLLFIFEKLFKLFSGHYLNISDNALGLISSAVVMVYFVFAAKFFYSLNTNKAIGIGFIFLIGHFIIVQVIYKFLLFYISINLAH